ncbi:Curli production assembly/transport component CsgG [compost metagenome]
MREFVGKFAKGSMIILGAGIMMGNQKCEKPVVQQRTLKKLVEMGSIQSSPIYLPGGNAFDFQFVANQQVYGVLMENDHFALRYAPPISMPPSQATPGDANFFNLTKADGQMMKSFAQQAGKDDYSVQYAKTAWCMVNLPQAKIAGSVNSFEMIGGGGVTIGFTPAGPVGNGLTSAGLNVEWAQLDLSMVATRPLTSKVMAASNVTSKQTKTKMSFGLNFGAFSVGPSAYYQTPLAAVTKKALTTAVDNLDTELKSEEWYTRVMANHDTHLIVVGGTDVKLEVGDQLLIYNEDYYWDGEPCNSRYLGGGAAAGSAVAKIELDWVGDEISRGRVIEQNDHNAVIGAKVKLFKFHAPDYVAPDAGVQDLE